MPIRVLWNNYMKRYDFLTQVEGYRRNILDLVEAIQPRPGMKILDAGSGTGNLSIALKRKGAIVTSCDFSESALRKHLEKDPAASVMQISLEERLPFRDESFDSICCASVLFTLSESGCSNALREFQRVLRPGGAAYITVSTPQTQPGNLVSMHLNGLIKIHGPVTGRLRFMADLPALLQIFYYNRQLKNLQDWQGFHRFSEFELSGLIKSVGLSCPHIQKIYGNCFMLAVANKPLTAA